MKHAITLVAGLLLAQPTAGQAAETTPTKPDMALPPCIQAEKSGGLGFDDALGKMEAVLEAQPGQAAVQHLPLTHTESVRLVGWIQKLSLGTDAVLELLVEGRAIRSINHRQSPGTWELADEGGSVFYSKNSGNGLRIHDNRIDYHAAAPMPNGPDNTSGVNLLYLKKCNKIALQGNLTQS